MQEKGATGYILLGVADNFEDAEKNQIRLRNRKLLISDLSILPA